MTAVGNARCDLVHLMYTTTNWNTDQVNLAELVDTLRSALTTEISDRGTSHIQNEIDSTPCYISSVCRRNSFVVQCDQDSVEIDRHRLERVQINININIVVYLFRYFRSFVCSFFFSIRLIALSCRPACGATYHRNPCV